MNRIIIENLEKVNTVLTTENQTESQIENQIKALQALFKPRPKKKIKRVQNKKEVIGSKAYRQDEAIILIEISNGKVVDIRPVKTIETLEKFLEKSNKNFMVLPNPVKIPEDYWIEYKKAKTPADRIKLAKKFGLLKDENILNISYIVIDIDSPFEEVYPVWQEFLQKTEIDKGYIVSKTKSERFRAYIGVSGEFNDGKKAFKHTVNGKARNGKTHLENAYEIQYILASFFEKRGLNVDSTFVGRLNHPVWIEEREINGKKSQLYEIKEGEILLYELYNKMKKLQREEGLWTFNGKNITQIRWPEKWKEFKKKENRKNKIKIKDNLTNEKKLEIALQSLLKKHKTNRFKSVMMPVCGWAKFLKIDKNFVYELLKKYLHTKSNFEEDFEKAWRYSTELEFIWTYEEEGLTKRIERSLKVFVSEGKEFKIYVKRKELVKLYKTEAEYYEVERYLTEKGYIETGYIKTGKKGRPEKRLTLTQEGIKLIERWLNGEDLEDLLNDRGDKWDNPDQEDFSLYNYSLSIEREQPIGGLVGNGWKENDQLLNQPISLSNPNHPTKPNTYQPNKPSKNQTTIISSSSKPKKTLYGGGLKDSGGFTREARIMAILLGYEREQMARAVVNISKCISYFSSQTNNLDEAIHRTFAVYLYLSERTGKKVFIDVGAIKRFEEESLQTEISNVAWGYFERYKEKYEKYKLKQEQKQKGQREKWKQKQKGFWRLE